MRTEWFELLAMALAGGLILWIAFRPRTGAGRETHRSASLRRPAAPAWLLPLVFWAVLLAVPAALTLPHRQLDLDDDAVLVRFAVAGGFLVLVGLGLLVSWLRGDLGTEPGGRRP